MFLPILKSFLDFKLKFLCKCLTFLMYFYTYKSYVGLPFYYGNFIMLKFYENEFSNYVKI